jgi:hypothetical protein
MMLAASPVVRERIAAEQAAEAMVERYGPLPGGEEREARRARERWMRRSRELARRYLIEAQVGDARAARVVRDDTHGDAAHQAAVARDHAGGRP